MPRLEIYQCDKCGKSETKKGMTLPKGSYISLIMTLSPLMSRPTIYTAPTWNAWWCEACIDRHHLKRCYENLSEKQQEESDKAEKKIPTFGEQIEALIIDEVQSAVEDNTP